MLPFVLNVKEAMAPGAPIVLEDLRDQEFGQIVANEPMDLFMAPSKSTSDKPGNVAAHFQFQRGDLEAGFKAADYIVEREFNTEMVHQGYIEPHNAVGIYNSDGHATFYCSTQGPFDVRGCSARCCWGFPQGNIRVVPAEIGGGFGGKTTVYLEPIALLLSKKTGHPVKLVMTRAEVLRATGPTSGSWIKVKMGATKDGKITAAESSWRYEAGAFPGSPVGPGAMSRDRALRHPQLPDRRLRRGGQPAQDRRLPGARRHQRGLRVGERDRRIGGEMRDRSDRFPDQERRQGRHAAGRRTEITAHRLCRGLRGDQEQPSITSRR